MLKKRYAEAVIVVNYISSLSTSEASLACEEAINTPTSSTSTTESQDIVLSHNHNHSNGNHNHTRSNGVGINHRHHHLVVTDSNTLSGRYHHDDDHDDAEARPVPPGSNVHGDRILLAPSSSSSSSSSSSCHPSSSHPEPSSSSPPSSSWYQKSLLNISLGIESCIYSNKELLFHDQQLRSVTLTLLVIWFMLSFGSYGISTWISNLFADLGDRLLPLPSPLTLLYHIYIYITSLQILTHPLNIPSSILANLFIY